MLTLPFFVALAASMVFSPAIVADDPIVTQDTPVIVKVVQTPDGRSDVQVMPPNAEAQAICAGSGDGPVHVETIVLNGRDGTVSTSGADGLKIALACAKDAGPRNIDVGGPWLGIQFGPVSKPLQSQLRLTEGVGQMVLNVVNDSPADSAALEQYDVIVSMNGNEVSDKIGDFMTMVREFEPGETISLDLIRGGDRVNRDLVIGAHPEKMGGTKYKYELAVEELHDGGEFFRGGMLQQNDDGSWSFNDLHADDVLDVWSAMPDGSAWSGDAPSLFNFYAKPGCLPTVQGKTFVWKQADAQGVRIEQADDGKITVVRTETDDDGNETTTTKTYADEDELKAGDPEAAEFMGGHHLSFYSGDGAQAILKFMGDGARKDIFMNLAPGDDAVGLDVAKLREQIREAMNTTGASVQLEDLQGGLKALDLLKDMDLSVGAGKASVSFKLSKGGKIYVTTRQGDEELTQVFEDAKEMKETNSDLFRKYNTLHSGHDKTPPIERK